MEDFKKFDEITQPDIRHSLVGEITGRPYNLEILYNEIRDESLNNNVPETIKNQFNIIKNLIIYSWFSYPLATIADLKLYILIEHALKKKYPNDDMRFGQRVQKAIDDKLIVDAGFRHIKLSDDPQEYCKKLPKILPKLRNELAHGSAQLDFECINSLKICADIINQIFIK